MNTTKTRYLLMSTVAVASMAGCSDTGSRDVLSLRVEIQRRYSTGPNTSLVNGRQINGRQINGTQFNGRQINGRQVNGTFENNVINGEPVSLVYIDAVTGLPYMGPDIVGTEVAGHMSDGSTRELRFAAYDSATVPGTNLYLVNYADSGESVCGDRHGEPIWAAILPQKYNETTGDEVATEQNQYTFSCRFGALQKCQEIGYMKNGSATETYSGITRVRSLNDYHAACVRMMRADYCGDGVSHTFNGTPVDVYDQLTNSNEAVTATNGADGYYYESEWDVDGAHCLSMTRWMPSELDSLAMNRSSANPDWEYVRVNCPGRIAFPVLMVDGQMSTPDRACGAASSWNTSVGFSLYSSNTPTQVNRSKIRTNTMLNTYGF